jgi:hypothetical protein
VLALGTVAIGRHNAIQVESGVSSVANVGARRTYTQVVGGQELALLAAKESLQFVALALR